MINIDNAFKEINEYFSPRVVGQVNDHFIKIAKIQGQDIPWHNHEGEDEAFYILSGSLLMEIENEPPFVMNQGDIYVVKKGVNHRVSSKKECQIMLIEPSSTEHTGKVQATITKSIKDQLGKMEKS